MYYCVKQYNAGVYNGVFYETETTIPKFRRSPFFWQSNVDPDPDKNELKSVEYGDEDEGSLWSDLMLESDSGSKYSVSQNGVHGISAYFQSTFRNEVNLSDYDLPGVLSGWALSYNGRRDYSPAIMQTLWESPNLSATFDALARSMSNAIRASDYSPGNTSSSSVHTGVAQVVVILYSVQWEWIALHVALMLAGLVFLAFTIWKTISLEIPAWKSHSLPPLAFSYQVDNLFSGTDSIRVMEQRAAKHYVRFAAFVNDAMSLAEVAQAAQVAQVAEATEATEVASSGRISPQQSRESSY